MFYHWIFPVALLDTSSRCRNFEQNGEKKIFCIHQDRQKSFQRKFLACHYSSVLVLAFTEFGIWGLNI